MTESDTEAEAPGTAEPPEWLVRPTAFMNRVAEVCATPGGRADLRTGRSPGWLAEPWRMLPHLVAYIPRQGGRDVETAHLAVAAMYAAQADNPTVNKGEERSSLYNPAHGNLGATLAHAVHRGILREENATQKLQLFARQTTVDGLLRNLRPLVDRLAAERLPLSWPRLLNDLRRWPIYRTDIARDWMRAYYSPNITETEESSK